MPNAGERFMRLNICCSQPSVTTVSLLSSTIYSPRAADRASLHASGIPRSVSVRTVSTRIVVAALMPAKYSAVPSREPMSKKINSKGGRVKRRTLGTHSFVYSIIPQHGMMMDASEFTTEILDSVGAFAAAPVSSGRLSAMAYSGTNLTGGCFDGLGGLVLIFLRVAANQVDQEQVFLLMPRSQMLHHFRVLLQ